MTGPDTDKIRGIVLLGTVVLVGLKLSGEIAWYRVVVAAPLWLPLAISVSLRLAALAVVLAAIYLARGARRRDCVDWWRTFRS